MQRTSRNTSSSCFKAHEPTPTKNPDSFWFGLVILGSNKSPVSRSSSATLLACFQQTRASWATERVEGCVGQLWAHRVKNALPTSLFLMRLHACPGWQEPPFLLGNINPWMQRDIFFTLSVGSGPSGVVFCSLQLSKRTVIRWFTERRVPLSFTRCQALSARKNAKRSPKKFLGHPHARLDRSAPPNVWPRFLLFPRL